MALAVVGGVPHQVARPVRRAPRLEVGIRKGAQGRSDLAVHGTVVVHDRSRGSSAPAFIEDPVLLGERQTAELRIGWLRSERAERLTLPLHDVGERILPGPALARDPGARAESGNGPPEAGLRQAPHHAVEGTVLGVDPFDDGGPRMPDLPERHYARAADRRLLGAIR